MKENGKGIKVESRVLKAKYTREMIQDLSSMESIESLLGRISDEISNNIVISNSEKLLKRIDENKRI